MTGANLNVLGLVELVDADDLFDTYGANGFQGLRKTFVERSKQWIRSSDQWRLVGENRFCVILRGLNSEVQIDLAAAKLARLFSDPCLLGDEHVQLEVRAGFVAMDSAPGSNTDAVKRAGRALKRARDNHRLFEIYSSEQDAGGVDARQLMSQLELAVERGELELYFQPKIHAGYRTLIGAEALVRWHTPEGTVLMPDDFIPLAEKHRVIHPLTAWSIKAAIARLAQWPEQLSLSVNVTPRLFLDDAISALISDSLEIYGVKPERLTIEVTETIMAESPDIMLRELARLRQIGVRVSIDDFGTGFSSLAYFRDLPADEIKIDKCFVLSMMECEKDLAIVKAVIDLAHNFSLKVVAEGVESNAIADHLAGMRCDILQGYAFDKPLMLQDFEQRYLKPSAVRH